MRGGRDPSDENTNRGAAVAASAQVCGVGKRGTLCGQGSSRQSAVRDVGNGNPIGKYLLSAHYVPGALLLLDEQGSGQAGKYFLKLIGFWWDRG